MNFSRQADTALPHFNEQLSTFVTFQITVERVESVVVPGGLKYTQEVGVYNEGLQTIFILDIGRATLYLVFVPAEPLLPLHSLPAPIGNVSPVFQLGAYPK